MIVEEIRKILTNKKKEFFCFCTPFTNITPATINVIYPAWLDQMPQSQWTMKPGAVGMPLLFTSPSTGGASKG
jgi:hypothetical protein